MLRSGNLSLSLVAAIVASLAAVTLASAAANNLQQIAVSIHSGGPDTLSQIGLAIDDGGTYQAGDGSVRTIPGDGSVRFISIGAGSQDAFCFHNVQINGPVDGTSNTIFLGEAVGLTVASSFARGTQDGVRSIVDGTSNTITLPETNGFCLGGVTGVDPVPGADSGGGENGVFLGGNSSFDACFGSASLSAPIIDGTSNTISFGETRSNVCFNNIVVSPDVQVIAIAAAEPGSLALLLPAMLGLTALGYSMQRARSPIA
jgi:hypothetical protein